MPFVRKKKVNGVPYYYLVATSRVDGKVKQKTLLCLGQHSSPKSALRAWESELSRIEKELELKGQLVGAFIQRVKHIESILGMPYPQTFDRAVSLRLDETLKSLSDEMLLELCREQRRISADVKMMKHTCGAMLQLRRKLRVIRERIASLEFHLNFKRSS